MYVCVYVSFVRDLKGNLIYERLRCGRLQGNEMKFNEGKREKGKENKEGVR